MVRWHKMKPALHYFRSFSADYSKN